MKCQYLISEWKKTNRSCLPKCKRIKGLVKMCCGMGECEDFKRRNDENC